MIDVMVAGVIALIVLVGAYQLPTPCANSTATPFHHRHEKEPKGQSLHQGAPRARVSQSVPILHVMPDDRVQQHRAADRDSHSGISHLLFPGGI